MRHPIHEYAVEETVDTHRFRQVLSAVENALGCDAYVSGRRAAQRALRDLADECERLADAIGDVR